MLFRSEAENALDWKTVALNKESEYELLSEEELEENLQALKKPTKQEVSS